MNSEAVGSANLDLFFFFKSYSVISRLWRNLSASQSCWPSNSQPLTSHRNPESEYSTCNTCFLMVFVVCVTCYSSVNEVFVEPGSKEDDEGRSSRLWVDRYSPRHYTELLSDDVRDVFVRKKMSRCRKANCEPCTDARFLS